MTQNTTKKPACKEVGQPPADGLTAVRLGEAGSDLRACPALYRCRTGTSHALLWLKLLRASPWADSQQQIFCVSGCFILRYRPGCPGPAGPWPAPGPPA